MGRSSKSFFISNYFQSGLLTRETNTDIKPMFNRFKAVTYMRAYFSKTKVKKARKSGKKIANYKQIKLIADACTSKREKQCLTSC